MQRRDLRAADSDRQAISDRLRIAAQDGRLDVHEYDERLQMALAAKTFGELDDLVADLPDVRPEDKSRVSRVDNDAVDSVDDDDDEDEDSSDIRNVWVSLGGAAVFFTGLWVLGWIGSGGAPPFYWPLWILGFWTIGAVVTTMHRTLKR